MTKAIIFDMDGTLLDTEKVKENGWKYAGECIGIKIDDKIISQIRGTNTKHTKELFNKIFGNIDFQKLHTIREKFIEQDINTNGIKAKKGLYEILEFLQENNYKMAVASSSSEKTIKEYLKKMNVLHYFDVILAGDMVEKGKPNPEIYLKAVQQLKIPKEKCIGVEDSPNGILSVYRAGIRAIMIPDLTLPTKEMENIVYTKLNSLLDLIDLLKEE